MGKFIKYLDESTYLEEKIKYEMAKNCQPFLKEIKQHNIKKFIYRGTNKKIIDIEKIIPRKNRKPKDMSPNLQKIFDEFFYKKFRWKPRSEGVFTIGDIKSIRGVYGIPYIFVPIGEYKYLWSPDVDDLYEEIDYEDYSDEFDDFNLEDDWENRYGEEENGTWEYDGKPLNIRDKQEAIEYIENEIDENFNPSKLKWIPEKSYEEFYNEIKEEFEEKKEYLIKNLVDSYLDTELLRKAINKKHEIMFKCDSYYLINRKHEDFLKTFMFG